MNVLNSIELIDLAIYTNKTLILTDFHIGYEEALNKQGLMVPRFQFQEIMKRLEKIFSRLKNKSVERIIVNGDLKHEFGTISEQEWRHTLRLLDYFGQHCKEVILIKGNHDTILGPIAKKRNVKVLENYLISTIEKKPIKNDSIKEITINTKTQFEIIKNKIGKKSNGKNKILVILDSNHTHAHVLAELQQYSNFITKGSYLIVLDTIIEDMSQNFFKDRSWDKGNNPKTAVHEFLKKNKRFKIDKEIENKLLITVAPDGYLKCIRN